MEGVRCILVISVIVWITDAAQLADTKTENTSKLQRNFVTEEPWAERIPTTRQTPFPTEEPVTVLERFFRIYEDRTMEMKLVLSNGVAEYQKITNKIYNGKTIQVQEGYQSVKLPDNTYRTIYYIADENGYRIRRREYDTIPPVLPVYVPHVPKL